MIATSTANEELEKLKYPVGKFKMINEFSTDLLQQFIRSIETFPIKIKSETSYLSKEQLDTPYREGGWTIRQVVHHCADSHMNGFIRMKLALTENTPTIKPYMEALWAEFNDTKKLPVNPSFLILEGLHVRWVALLKSLDESDLQKTYFHPEHKKKFTIYQSIQNYSWHCNHHLAHITSLKKRMGW